MAFNNGLKRKQFEARWNRLREEYAASGMDESTIAALYEFDRQTFNSNRRYAEHTQVLCNQGAFDDGDEGGEDKSTMLLKFFDSLTTGIVGYILDTFPSYSIKYITKEMVAWQKS